MKLPLLALTCTLLAAGAASQAMPASPSAHHVFRPPVTTPTPPAWDVAFADLDGNGRVDAVSVLQGGLERRLGLGGGAFGPPVMLPGQASLAASAIALDDFNGDGVPDLAGVKVGANGFVRFAMGDGAGGFGAPVDLPKPVFFTWFAQDTVIETGDADGDGDKDVAIAVASDDSPGGGIVSLFLNDGQGAFTELPINTLLSTAVHLRPADFNGDALPDVLISAYTGIGPAAVHTVLLGDAQGPFPFVAGPSFEGNFIIDFVADLDADGDNDLVLGGDVASTWLNDGAANFTHAADLSLGFFAFDFGAADFDADGNLDLFASHAGLGEVRLLLGGGDGSFEVSSALSMLAGNAFSARGTRIADLDGDGGQDLVAQRDVSGSTGLSAVANVTYAAGGPIADWGGARRGFGGWPVERVTGSLLPGTPVHIELDLARANATAWMVFGLDASFSPFKGGVIVPRPDAIVGPLPTGAAGAVDVHGTWPAGLPVGTTVNMQWWIPDFGGFKGFAASGSVHLVQP